MPECDRLHCNDTIGRCATCPLDVQAARDVFYAEYHRLWRAGGDAGDHDEAMESAIEAVRQHASRR